jgi:hypothetical protein
VPGRFESLSGPVDFDPGPGSDYKTGKGAFLTRFTPDGSYVRSQTWAYESSSISYGHAVTTDDTGNVIIYGMFADSIDLDPGIGFDEHITNGLGAFICKLDESGGYVWGLSFGPAQSAGYPMCIANGLGLDSTGNVYGSGYFNGTMDFDPGPGTEIADGSFYDSFLVKFTSDGKF